MKIKKLAAEFVLLSAVLTLAMPAGAQAPNLRATKAASNVYIVRMSESPVVAYDGGISGYPATRPARGQKIDPNSTNVVRYAGYLDSRHNDALNAVGGGRKLYDYRYSFNGFAAQLSPAQADAIKQVLGVLTITKDELHNMNTSSTPSFLGLDAPGGLWDQLGGTDKAGEGIIIGLIVSGIWPESLSFSDRTGLNGNATKDGKLSYQ